MCSTLLPALLLAVAPAGPRHIELSGGTPVALSAGEFAPSLVHELSAGLAALPSKVRAFPGGPLELELHTSASPFGMGDGSGERPDFTGGWRRFHLYAYEEGHEERASHRLSALSAEERERLWRRRAMVHAVLARWNEAFRWSRRLGFRRVTGWDMGLGGPLASVGRPANPYPWAYSRARGMESASLDLLTFAEEALVPPEAMRASAAVAADDSLPCQEFSKLRFLSSVLSGLTGESPQSLFPPQRCPAFERWASFATLSHLEVLFAASSGARPESLFGHVMLRAVHEGEGAPLSEPVVEIGALSGPGDDFFRYGINGLSGGYAATFTTTSMRSVLRAQVEGDQRSLRRFRLNLSAEEQRRLLMRIWELERRGYFPYYFLTDNCAGLLLFAIQGALDDHKRLERPGKLAVLPTAAIDALASVRVLGPSRSALPLAVREAGDFDSHEAEAARAELEQGRHLSRLVALSPLEIRRRWEAAGRGFQSKDPSVRREVYASLSALLEDTFRDVPAASEEAARNSAMALLLARLAVERYAADLAKAAEEKLEASRIVAAPAGIALPTAVELFEERARLYRREDQAARADAEIRRAVAMASYLEAVVKREHRVEEREQLAEARAAREAYSAAAGVVGDFLDRYFPGAEPAQVLGATFRRRLESERAALSRSLSRSGFGKLSLGAAASASGEVSLMVKSAIVSERLGEQRANGFGPHTEVRLLDAESAFGLSEGKPALRFAEVALVRFRALPKSPESARRSAFDSLGFGVGLEHSLNGGGGQRALLHGELYAVPHAAPRFEGFTAVGLGLMGEASFPSLLSLPTGLSVGPRIEISHRTPLTPSGPGAVRVEAWYSPRLSTSGGQPALLHEARATVSAELAVHGEGRELVIAPAIDLCWSQLGRSGTSTASASLSVQWL
ncbi:MAG: DUF4105 domain-containing protein [Myxococcales bacterium]|nr:DUF4105 domain-containing protein [Myxococcales bacterium]